MPAAIPSIHIEATANVEDGAKLGLGTRVWHQAQIRADVVVGDHCVIGKGVYLGLGTRLGRNCKVQNYACLNGAQIEDGVLIAPHVTLIEDSTPRARTVDGERQMPQDWQA